MTATSGGKGGGHQHLTTSQRISRSVTPVEVCQNLPFDRYERTASHLQRQLSIYRDESNHRQVYRIGLGFISLVQETMKRHDAWRENEERFLRWTREAEGLCGELEKLKGEINRNTDDEQQRQQQQREERGAFEGDATAVPSSSYSSSSFASTSMGKKTMVRPPPVGGGGSGAPAEREVKSEKADGNRNATPSTITGTTIAAMRTKGEAAKTGKHSLLSGEVIAEKVKGLDIGASSDAPNPSSGSGENRPLTMHRTTIKSLLDDDNDSDYGYSDGALKPSTPPPPPPVAPFSSTTVSGTNQYPTSYDYVPSAGSIEFRPSVVLQHAQKPPSSSAASLDHLKLDKRLERYGLKEFIVNGDGNCQFRAISDQLYGDQSHHASVRAVVIGQMRARPDRYAAFVESPDAASTSSYDNTASQTYGGANETDDELANYRAYLRNMSKLGAWGDHVTLQAASDAYGLPFCVITSYRDNFVLEIQPETLKTASEKVLWISFWSEVHYNSLYPIDSSKFS
jgi:hypothetical protein